MLGRLIRLASPITALFGVAGFVVATIYLALERCSTCTGFLEGMNKTPSLSRTGLVMLGIVILLACVGRRGRGFAVGFFAALVVTGFTMFRSTLFLWGVADPVWRSFDLRPVDRRIERLEELSKQPLDEQVGGALIYRVLDCITSTPPSLATEIASGTCLDLMVRWDGYRGSERLSRADSGWRWTYTKFAEGFQVAVYPDVMLNQPTPEFGFDETRRVTIRRGGSRPPSDYPRPR